MRSQRTAELVRSPLAAPVCTRQIRRNSNDNCLADHSVQRIALNDESRPALATGCAHEGNLHKYDVATLYGFFG
jgi:hypothetical protein